MTFTPRGLIVTYHLAALAAVAVWAPWWALLAWLFLCFAVVGCVSDRRTELLLVFIPQDDRIERQELQKKVEEAHASPFVPLFWPLLRLRRRGLIESWNELVCLPGEDRESVWCTYYRRLR